MINKNNIIDILKENDLSDIEEIKYKEEFFVVRFFYDFDEDEIKAAKAYANDQAGEDKKSWVEDFYLPYLTDLAIDNVGEFIEELMDKVPLAVQFMSYDLNSEEADYLEFIAIFYEEKDEIDIEVVLDELEL